MLSSDDFSFSIKKGLIYFIISTLKLQAHSTYRRARLKMDNAGLLQLVSRFTDKLSIYDHRLLSLSAINHFPKPIRDQNLFSTRRGTQHANIFPACVCALHIVKRFLFTEDLYSTDYLRPRYILCVCVCASHYACALFSRENLHFRR